MKTMLFSLLEALNGNDFWVLPLFAVTGSPPSLSSESTYVRFATNWKH